MRSDRPWKGAPYQASEFCYPRAPHLVYLCKPPRSNMDGSNLRQPPPSFIQYAFIIFLYPALEEALKFEWKQSYCTIKSQRREWTFIINMQRRDFHLLSSISRHLESHLGFTSSDLYQRSVWRANKEREGVREREWESEDVLIKGNSEGLNQIILHNLVREDTAFDTEKMEMTCPQRHIPMVWN